MKEASRSSIMRVIITLIITITATLRYIIEDGSRRGKHRFRLEEKVSTYISLHMGVNNDKPAMFIRNRWHTYSIRKSKHNKDTVQ